MVLHGHLFSIIYFIFSSARYAAPNAPANLPNSAGITCFPNFSDRRDVKYLPLYG